MWHWRVVVLNGAGVAEAVVVGVTGWLGVANAG